LTVTCEWVFAVAPPAGDCAITLPSGCVPGTKATLATKPA
jgi:hypothetical protein